MTARMIWLFFCTTSATDSLLQAARAISLRYKESGTQKTSIAEVQGGPQDEEYENSDAYDQQQGAPTQYVGTATSTGGVDATSTQHPASLFAEELERITDIDVLLRSGFDPSSVIPWGTTYEAEHDMKIERVQGNFMSLLQLQLKPHFEPASLPLVALPLGTSALRWGFADRVAHYWDPDPDWGRWRSMRLEPRVAVRTTLEQLDFAVPHKISEANNSSGGGPGTERDKLFPVPLPRRVSNTTSEDVKISSFFERAAQWIAHDYPLEYLRAIGSLVRGGDESFLANEDSWFAGSLRAGGDVRSWRYTHAGVPPLERTGVPPQERPGGIKSNSRPRGEGFHDCRLWLRTSSRDGTVDESEFTSSNFSTTSGAKPEMDTTITLLEKKWDEEQASSLPSLEGFSRAAGKTGSPFGELTLAKLLDEVPDEVWERHHGATSLTSEEPNLVLVKLSISFEYDTAFETVEKEVEKEEQGRIFYRRAQLLTFDGRTSFDLLLFRGSRLRARQLAVRSLEVQSVTGEEKETRDTVPSSLQVVRPDARREHLVWQDLKRAFTTFEFEPAESILYANLQSLAQHDFSWSAVDREISQLHDFAAVRWGMSTKAILETLLLCLMPLTDQWIPKTGFLWLFMRRNPALFEFAASSVDYHYILHLHFLRSENAMFETHQKERKDANSAALTVEPSMRQDVLVFLRILSSTFMPRKGNSDKVRASFIKNWTVWFCSDGVQPQHTPDALTGIALRAALAGAYFMHGRRRFLDFMAVAAYRLSIVTPGSRTTHPLIEGRGPMRRCLLSPLDADAVQAKVDRLEEKYGPWAPLSTDIAEYRVGDFPGLHCEPPLDRIHVQLATLDGNGFAASGEQNFLRKYHRELDSGLPGAVSPRGGRDPIQSSDSTFVSLNHDYYRRYLALSLQDRALLPHHGVDELHQESLLIWEMAKFLEKLQGIADKEMREVGIHESDQGPAHARETWFSFRIGPSAAGFYYDRELDTKQADGHSLGAIMEEILSHLSCNNPHLRRAQVEVTLSRGWHTIRAVVSYFLDAFPPPEEVGWIRMGRQEKTAATGEKTDHAATGKKRQEKTDHALPTHESLAVRQAHPGSAAVVPKPVAAQDSSAARDAGERTARLPPVFSGRLSSDQVDKGCCTEDNREPQKLASIVLVAILSVAAVVVAGLLIAMCRDTERARRAAAIKRKMERRDLFYNRERARRARAELERRTGRAKRLQAILKKQGKETAPAQAPPRTNEENVATNQEAVPGVGASVGGRGVIVNPAIASKTTEPPNPGGEGVPLNSRRGMLTDKYVLTLQPPRNEPGRRSNKKKETVRVGLQPAAPSLRHHDDGGLGAAGFANVEPGGNVEDWRQNVEAMLKELGFG
ncbi:unnamed protein product [Amoebophrya sp. A120]|nr:unnamed protein product [Amoebophrya sp. A120]|eukprot:GSA120T00002514001.1